MIWEFDNLERIGGHAVTVIGEPQVIDTPEGKAIEFDGEDDGILLPVHPLAGMDQFTAEVIFNPYAEGRKAQRFFHMEETGETEDRVMFETRLTDDGLWFLDTYVKSGENSYPQLAEDYKHPIEPWWHAAIVMDDSTISHYVNGELEMSSPVIFEPQEPGQTSVGMRLNQVHWYKGAVRVARFTPEPLKPEAFLGH